MQSAYLQVSEATLRAAESSVYVYEAATGAILQSLRKPKFLVYIRDNSGELAELVLESLLEHGRMRVEQVFPPPPLLPLTRILLPAIPASRGGNAPMTTATLIYI